MVARKAQIITPRTDLKRKAVNNIKGVDLTLPPKLLAELEQVVHRSRDKFVIDLTKRLALIREACDAVEQGGMTMRLFIPKVHRECLEIKGAGGTIGYHLVSEIGHLMDILLRGKEDLSPTQMQVFQLAVGAIFVVLAEKIMGGGAQLEQQVVASLSEAVHKYG
jgi:hypothetical protein